MTFWEIVGRAAATWLLLWLHWKAYGDAMKEVQRNPKTVPLFWVIGWCGFVAFGAMIWACWTLGR